MGDITVTPTDKQVRASAFTSAPMRAAPPYESVRMLSNLIDRLVVINVELREQANVLRRENDTLKADIAELADELDDYETEVGYLNARIAKLEMNEQTLIMRMAELGIGDGERP